MHFLLHRLYKRLKYLFAVITDWCLFIGIVLIGGLGSSWYMVSAGSAITTDRVGPWTSWVSEGRSDPDPYTRAYLARQRSFNLSTEIARTYYARTDEDGVRLHSSCDYAIEGGQLDASWWSVTAYDSRGRLIPNSADRYSYSSDTVALTAKGRFTVSLARNARPGNWIPTGGAGRLVLVFTVLEGRSSLIIGSSPDEGQLPKVRKVRCR